MIEAAVIRTPAGTLAAATAADAEILRSLQAGKAYRVKVTQLSGRSYRHHKLFFGGLLPLAYERACFQVAWNMMLSAKFDSEEAALRAAEEMMEFGA